MAIFTVPCFAVNGLYNHDYHEYGDPNTLYSLIVPFYDNASELFNQQKFTAQPFSINLGNKPTTVNGYTPRNKKLLTYPYCYLGSSSNNSSKNIYRFEHFSGNSISFKATSEINPNPSVYITPQNYKNVTNNLNESIILTGYPQISWLSDTFNAWLAQNSQIISLNMEQESFNTQIELNKQMVDTTTNTLGQAFNADYGAIPTALSGALNIAQTQRNHEFYIKQQMAQIEKQKLLPNTANFGTSNATLLGYSNLDDNIFSVITIQAQFAEKIDKYFDLYGYATNLVKVPNLNNRSNWNYIKTIGANITGNIPQTDLLSIKSLFDNGITLWHTTTDYLDYSKTNS